MCVQPHTHMWSAIKVDVRGSTATDVMTIMRCEDSSELLSKNYAMQRISNVRGLTSGKSQGCSFVTHLWCFPKMGSDSAELDRHV